MKRLFLLQRLRRPFYPSARFAPLLQILGALKKNRANPAAIETVDDDWSAIAGNHAISFHDFWGRPPHVHSERPHPRIRSQRESFAAFPPP
ncbi:unnamed protein product [Amoebophrya sp. A120]|nr:unnamed protein product [Amoebophrya sp. A120]|eukprot:GSA120T00024427001.1